MPPFTRGIRSRLQDLMASFLTGSGSQNTGNMFGGFGGIGGNVQETASTDPVTAPTVVPQQGFVPEAIIPSFGNLYQNDFLLPWLMFT